MVWFLSNIIAIFGSLVILGIAVWLDPDPRGYGTHEQLGLAPCDFMVKHGYPCPSCGLTTSFANMAELNVAAASRANPAGVLLFLVTLSMPLWFGYALWTRTDPFRFATHRIGRWVLPAVVLLLVICWIVRTG